jgi:hypothetical protein
VACAALFVLALFPLSAEPRPLTAVGELRLRRAKRAVWSLAAPLGFLTVGVYFDMSSRSAEASTCELGACASLGIVLAALIAVATARAPRLPRAKVM